MQPTRVLIADDSPTMRHYLSGLIDVSEDFQVVGQAQDGADAIRQVAERQPDVVLMDIKMPNIDGLAATRHIMQHCPTPVVVISSQLDVDVRLSLQALNAGALAVMSKLPNRHSPTLLAKQRELLNILRAMAQVSVVTRRRRVLARHQEQPSHVATGLLRARVSPSVLAIGASTGGPSALQRLLQALPADFPVPIVVVQHMPAEFVSGLVRWLSASTPLVVRLAQQGEPLRAGTVYVAQGDRDMVLRSDGVNLMARFIAPTSINHYTPSVDRLFSSVAAVCGKAAIGLILTGMGDDGARGLLEMYQAGAMTLAQDADSSTVFGMPRAAIDRGAVQQIESLSNLPAKILQLL